MKPVNRKELLKTLTKAKPAVATKDYVPILTYFMFDGDGVTAYNDLQAIRCECAIGIKACLPADLLMKALASFSADFVEFEAQGDSVRLTAGKTKVTLPSLPAADFPETMLKTKLVGHFSCTDEMLYGMSRCLLAVGNDASHADQMGLTLDPFYSEQQAALYSTDNATISRYTFDTDMELPDDAAIILPTIFCQQLLALAKLSTLPIVRIYKGSLIADCGDGVFLFTKSLVDDEPMNFAEVVDRYLDMNKIVLHELPDDFAQSVERALLIQDKEATKTTMMSVERKQLTMYSVSSKSEAEDVMDFDGDDVCFSIDPTLVKRVLLSVDRVAMLRRVLVFTGGKGSYLHLVSHVHE